MHMYYATSFYAHALTAFLLFVGFLFLITHFSKIKKIDSYKKIILILLFSIAIGIHGISHLGLETVYNYNPMRVFFTFT